MKKISRILLILCLVIIAVAAVLVIKNGLKFADNYSLDILLNTAKQYSLYIAITTVLTLVYLGIRYNKKGVIKVLLTSILTIIGTLVLIFAIFEISTLPISRLIFPMLISGYVASILVLTAYYEQNN